MIAICGPDKECNAARRGGSAFDITRPKLRIGWRMQNWHSTLVKAEHENVDSSKNAFPTDSDLQGRKRDAMTGC